MPTFFCICYLLPWCSAFQNMLFFQKFLNNNKESMAAQVAYTISALAQFLVWCFYLQENRRDWTGRVRHPFVKMVACAVWTLVQELTSVSVPSTTRGDFVKHVSGNKRNKWIKINWQIIWSWTVYFTNWENSMTAGIGGMQNTAAFIRGGEGLGALCNSALPSAQWVLGEKALTYLSIEFKCGMERESGVLQDVKIWRGAHPRWEEHWWWRVWWEDTALGKGLNHSLGVPGRFLNCKFPTAYCFKAGPPWGYFSRLWS